MTISTFPERRVLPEAVHQDFRWIEGDVQAAAHAQLLERTLDIAAGINTCLELVYASNMERLGNHDVSPAERVLPVLGVGDTDRLMRMSIATAALLREEARRAVECLNDTEEE